MSDFRREEFSEWLLDIHGLESEWQEARNCFKDFPAHMAYQAWQASRECLVVDLPKPAGLDRMSSEMSMQEIREDNRFNRALELAKKALTAAGVKYK